jgi:hypothetical protein
LFRYFIDRLIYPLFRAISEANDFLLPYTSSNKNYSQIGYDEQERVVGRQLIKNILYLNTIDFDLYYIIVLL